MAYDEAGVDRFLAESRAEQARLNAELERLEARARAATHAQQLVAGRIQTTYADLTNAARVELESIELAHSAAVASVRADAEAEAGSVLGAARAERPFVSDSAEGP